MPATPLTPCAVRLPGREIQAQLDGRRVPLSNISATGALLVTTTPLPVGQTVIVTLRRGATPLTIEARVVRSVLDEQSSYWQTAVAFLNTSKWLQRIISKLAS
jgi:hypothetical protein